ncbi:MAG: helix-turn-helix domain-containing protein [Deltaproteobacteria bacterium]|nr:helix-turn-helix domain-containing protein [Deltaproteobacteria bacterium]
MASANNVQRIPLTPAERAELERIIEVGPANLARRAHIILARAEGEPLSAIARSVGLHRDSVRRWLIRYRNRGAAGLQHGNAGKPKNVVFDATVRTEICRRASTPPAALGEPYSTWSLYKLRDHLIERDIVRTISVERLRQLLSAAGFARQYWHQPSTVGPLAPEVRHQLVALVRHPESDEAQRARAVLAIADGASISAVASTFHLGKSSIRRWLDHFRLGGIAGLTAPPEPAAAPTEHGRNGTAPSVTPPFTFGTGPSRFDDLDPSR